jgi:hypothetical protein
MRQEEAHQCLYLRVQATSESDAVKITARTRPTCGRLIADVFHRYALRQIGD